MKKTLLVLFFTLVVMFPCSAHKAVGYKPDRTMDCMAKIESYFKDKYNLTLEQEVIVYVTETYGEYKRVLERFHIPSNISKSSYAVSSRANGILIDGSELSDKHFFFVLAHELVHKYQMEHQQNPFKDYVKMEGEADIIASKISSYHIIVRDHGIRYKDLNTRDKFFFNCKIRINETLEQIRYYAQNMPFL